jgi:hypothetical protein
MSLFGGITHFLGNTLGATLGTMIGGPLGGFLGRIAGGFIGDLLDKVTSFLFKQVEQLASKLLPAGDARDIFEKAYESAFKDVFSDNRALSA